MLTYKSSMQSQSQLPKYQLCSSSFTRVSARLGPVFSENERLGSALIITSARN